MASVNFDFSEQQTEEAKAKEAELNRFFASRCALLLELLKPTNPYMSESRRVYWCDGGGFVEVNVSYDKLGRSRRVSAST
jgi:hypothetical protein